MAARRLQPVAPDPTTAPADSAVRCHVIDHRGSEPFSFDQGAIKQRLASGEFFWIDLHRPTEDEFGLLRKTFGFHPLAVEDSEHFGQRPKLDPYDDFVFLVAYGAAPDEDGLVEVHCFYSERYLVTVHRDECPAFTEVRDAATSAAAPSLNAPSCALPRRRRADRQLLPAARRLRRPHRPGRGPHLHATQRRGAPGDLRA